MKNMESNKFESYRLIQDFAKVFDAVPCSSVATMLGVDEETAERIMYKATQEYSNLYYENRVIYSSKKLAGRSYKPMLVYTDVCDEVGKLLKAFKSNEPYSICTFYHPKMDVIYRLYHVGYAMELSAVYSMREEEEDPDVRRLVIMDDMRYVDRFNEIDIEYFVEVTPSGDIEYYER